MPIGARWTPHAKYVAAHVRVYFVRKLRMHADGLHFGQLL